MHWLIDGHNLIGQLPGLRLDDPHDEEKLLEYLRRYRAATGHNITVVFDPGGGHHLGSSHKHGGIAIQFAPAGHTADQLLIRRIRQVKNPQAMIVVSSDRAVQQAARQSGIRVASAGEFAGQLLQLRGPAVSTDSEAKPEARLSAAEIDEWLKLFGGG
jgi:predicted RNA-binding protein with PIN domain